MGKSSGGSEAIAALHQELEFDRWAMSLQQVAGVWSQLQQLQRKASTPAGVQRYRTYLQRCIKNLQSNDAALAEAEVVHAETEWQALWDRENARLHERIVSRLPVGVEAWCEKWLPSEAKDYQLARNAWAERKTKRNMDRLLETTKAMIHKFEAIFD